MLAHSTVGYVALAYRSSGPHRATYYLIISVVTMLVIPQLRNAMPDAPGYDGEKNISPPVEKPTHGDICNA